MKFTEALKTGGEEVGLHSWDYLADDWEVMP